jgi:hypothetical protein
VMGLKDWATAAGGAQVDWAHECACLCTLSSAAVACDQRRARGEADGRRRGLRRARRAVEPSRSFRRTPWPRSRARGCSGGWRRGLRRAR